MKVLGVTGGIGMGKSACGQLLRERGVPVIDTDMVARELVEPGQAAFKEIVSFFGQGILQPSGELNRHELGRRVFVSSSDRKQLEAILHPRIRERWVKEVQQWSAEGRHIAAVIIPLLFETGAQAEMDVTVCLACSERTQKTRLLARGWDEEQIRRRIQAQMTPVRKMELSHHVIWTEGSLEIHEAQLDRILSLLTG